MNGSYVRSLIVDLLTRPRTAIPAFVLGIREFRSMSTTHFGGDLIEVYDAGRELTHLVTLRRFEP